MCVICFAPKGVKRPSKKLLTQMYIANQDGCGFATDTGKFFKSINFDEFYKEFKKVSINEGVVIHFRLGTCERVIDKHCHPFTDNNGIYFFHNGVLKYKRPGLTDSETFFQDYCIPALSKCDNKPRSHKFKKEFCKFNTGWSKFAFVDTNNKEISLFGNFTKAYGGLFFSNLNFAYRNFYFDYD